MLRIAIVEDHESDAKRLTALLEAYAQKNGKRFAITWIANANTFLDSYQHQYELVFMDIRMPGLNGMMAAHELREMDHTVVLVFLTSLAQYAVESYEVEATDYILKPITAAALDLKLPRILNRCMVESEEKVVIQSGGTTTRLRPNELHYVEIYDHHIQFVTASGIMRSYGTLKAVEDALPDVFFRVNNQTIVNLRFVTHVGSNDTTVAGRPSPSAAADARSFCPRCTLRAWRSKAGESYADMGMPRRHRA